MTYDLYSEGNPSGRHSHADFVGGLTEAIRQNPIPAALVGVGILWLFTGGRNVMLGRASGSVVRGMGHAAHDAGAGAYRGIREATSRVADGIQAATESAGRRARRLRAQRGAQPMRWAVPSDEPRRPSAE